MTKFYAGHNTDDLRSLTDNMGAGFILRAPLASTPALTLDYC